MASVRLYDWQVTKLKESGSSGASILRHAVRRYRRGDFDNVVQNKEKIKNKEKVPQLVSYSIKSRFDIPDSQLRDILTWHFEIRDKELCDKCSAEIKKLDAEIAEMMASITSVPYIAEEI